MDELNEKSELKINNKSTSISEEKINYQLMNKNNNKEKEIINTNYENKKSYIPNLKKVKSKYNHSLIPSKYFIILFISSSLSSLEA